ERSALEAQRDAKSVERNALEAGSRLADRPRRTVFIENLAGTAASGSKDAAVPERRPAREAAGLRVNLFCHRPGKDIKDIKDVKDRSPRFCPWWP
ncbi:MAG TPA: hypothetical protein VF414_09945, partial [Thermoanaerobaculia bacterium]